MSCPEQRVRSGARPLSDDRPLPIPQRSSPLSRAEKFQKIRFYTLRVVFIVFLGKKTEKNVTLFLKNQKTAKPA